MNGRFDHPVVSVIIPVHNARNPLRRAVEALQTQSLDRTRYEIIVVDNRSCDSPTMDLDQDGIICVSEASATNAYVARNAGLAVARGEIIAFTDADCVPAADWLARGVAALEGETADLAAGAIRFVRHQPDSAAMIYDATHFLQSREAVADRSVAFMANLFVRRRVFHALGSLPTESISGTDVRFAHMATRAGFRLVYAPEATVEHPARDWRQMIVKALRVGYGKGLLTWRQATREVLWAELLAAPQVASLNPFALYRRVQAAGFPVNMPTALRTVAFGYVVAATALGGYVAGLARGACLPRRDGRRDTRPPAKGGRDVSLDASAGRRRTAPVNFSVVIEAINLQLAEMSGLAKCLESLEAQTLPIGDASAVTLVYTGDTPEAVLRPYCRRFSWLSLHKLPDGTGYEQAKALGAERMSSPLIVFCDSDCVYEPDWLEHLLDPLRDETVEIVGGQTAIRVESPYDLAVAMTFSFDGFTSGSALYEGERFHFNNVAFRARVLAAHPIRFGEPVYRCPRVYATSLRNAGVHIHRHPGARAHHAPPNGFTHFFWRYLFLGHDAAAYRRVLETERPMPGRRSWAADVWHSLGRACRSTGRALRQSPRNVLYLPFAVPIALLATGLAATGLVTRLLFPRLLLRVAPENFLKSSSFDRRHVPRRAA